MVALDLEADSLHSYREQICLVQVSTPAGNAILDPLAAPEVLPGLAPLLADPAVRTILHGGDYDVRLLKREQGIEVRNLFDTMIAAQFTGRERFGLAALLEEHFGVRLDKRHQRADWSRRPLGPSCWPTRPPTPRTSSRSPTASPRTGGSAASAGPRRSSASSR